MMDRTIVNGQYAPRKCLGCSKTIWAKKSIHYCTKKCAWVLRRKKVNALNQEFGRVNNAQYNNLNEKTKDDYVEEIRKREMSNGNM